MSEQGVLTVEAPQAQAALPRTASAPARPPGDAALPHMAQLDALRAAAIFGVMACHFLHYRAAQEGARGVTLFFVLSGFLITGILLKCRQYVERDGQPRLIALRQFYVRRFLRIFPLYYFAIVVLWLIHDAGARAGMGWHLAYLTNALMVHKHQQALGGGWSVSHFWSLAVEEQFYFVWPWLMLLLPRKAIVSTVCAVVVSGPLYRLIGGLLRISQTNISPLPFFWLDALGLGALLAIAADPSFGLRHLIKPARALALIGGIAAIVAGLYLERVRRFPSVQQTIYYFGYASLSAWLVSKAAAGFAGIPGRIMSFKPLLWVGTVSYGVYVYHMIIKTYWEKLGAPLGSHEVWRALTIAVITIAVAGISFYFFEHPINNLKRYFPYRTGRTGMGRPGVIPVA